MRDIAPRSSASLAITRRYVWGSGADEPLVQYEGADFATRRYLVADERGSIIAITDASGNALSRNSYDEYGIPASTNTGRFQYTGQAWIPELGMYSYKARIYSPTHGRFLQTDPAGYPDGPNWYGYVVNDPVNGTDPSGMACAGVEGYPLSCDGGGGIGQGGIIGFDTAAAEAAMRAMIMAQINAMVREISIGLAQINGSIQNSFCNQSVDGKPSPSQVKAMARRDALIGVGGGALVAGLPGAIVGYGAVALNYGNKLRFGGSLVPTSDGGAAGNRNYGAATAGLGIPNGLSRWFAGLYEELGPNSNSGYDPKNGSALKIGDGGNGDSPAAQAQIREGQFCP